ncbi:MAG: FG-GAP-like repeat-containing protein [Phycisphaerales bacterium]|jgi:hypothetical protein
MMKLKLYILTAAVLLATTSAFAKTYRFTAFQNSLPTIGDGGGSDAVWDRGDTIAQIGNEQAWFCFDISKIPDTELITSAYFSARIRDYSENTTQRTLWYDPNDDWVNTRYHDPDLEESKIVNELIGTVMFNGDDWLWTTIHIDISKHNWTNDLLDNHVTLMLTGPLNGYYIFGDVDFREAYLELTTFPDLENANNTNTLLNFEAEELIQADGHTIEVPGYSVPSFVDWNNDDLNDLVIGEGGYSDPGKIRVYLNAGTEPEPQFSEYFYVQSDNGDLTCPASGCLGCFPRIVYWDADERKDLLVGQSDGTVKIFLNIGTDEKPAFDKGTLLRVGQPGSKHNIDVGNRATPSVTDWNNDGRKDLVAGAFDGRIHIFINEGSDTDPDFLVETFAKTNGSDIVVESLRSSPVVGDFNNDGRKDILTGNTDGQLLFYSNVGTDTEPDFSDYIFVESSYNPIDLPYSARSRPSVCYWTGNGSFGPIDGYLDALIGAEDGKVHLYRGKPVTGDIDGNGIVDFTDFALFAANWFRKDCGQCEGADFNNDSSVHLDDLRWFACYWLTGSK